VLRCPNTGGQLELYEDRILNSDRTEVARVEQGIARFPVRSPDDSITHYRKLGGAHFHERALVPFAMSALDTPIYHARIDEVFPSDRNQVIVDVGGGDGRNAMYCLNRGSNRIVVVDAVAEALVRFRQRVTEHNPTWLDRLLLIEADVRFMPLLSGCAACIIAIETLCYLNEDYAVGLKECARLMSPSAKIFISERDYEGALVLRLLYHGLDGMLQLANNRSLLDGSTDVLVRSRCFTQSELIDICRANGLTPLYSGGTTLLALILGYLNGRGLLEAGDRERLPDVTRLLLSLSVDSKMRRCHIVVAEGDRG
jgi:hypothetical protein